MNNSLSKLDKESPSQLTNFQFPSNLQSTRRHSTNSTSINKQILKSICNDTSRTLGVSKDKENLCVINQYKVEECIEYLQRKNTKQTEEIIMLTESYNNLKKMRDNELLRLEEETNKNVKYQTLNNNNTKMINSLKKKIVDLQNQNEALNNNAKQFDIKIIKVKEILRKKEFLITELQAKLDTNIEALENSLSQQEMIACLQENNAKMMKKQAKIEQEKGVIKNENLELANENAGLKDEIKQLKEKAWNLSEANKRLTEQCEELEKSYDQSCQESNVVIEQMKSVIDEQNEECSRLSQIVEKIECTEMGFKSNQFCMIYRKEISELLKHSIGDERIKNKIETGVFGIMTSMEESMNKVLLKVVLENE